MKQALRLTQWILGIAGFLMIGYWGYTTIDSEIFERDEMARLDAMRAPESEPAAAEKQTDGLIGRLEIPRLEISVAVMEGDSGAVLRRAAGHIAGTALPGEPGNAGISAHRDTFFRPLRNVRGDDEIRIVTPVASYRYRVVSTASVPPTDVSVLEAGDKESLTLVTCYPFYFVGPAPDRFVVRAERIGQ